MKREPAFNSWETGRVHRSGEHFRLRYGPVKEEPVSKWLLVALVGPPVERIVTVQFVADPDDPRSANAVNAAAKEIEFYLFELSEGDPWKYAKYHCGTFSNAFSDIHWSFHEARKLEPKPTSVEREPRQQELFRKRPAQGSLPFSRTGLS